MSICMRSDIGWFIVKTATSMIIKLNTRSTKFSNFKENVFVLLLNVLNVIQNIANSASQKSFLYTFLFFFLAF